jgi:tyrosine decarboxylase/aspartate 1-decarboxylase
MIYWRKLTHKEQDERITKALQDNVDYKRKVSLGIPASKLDPSVFYDQASFLADAPLLRTYVQNPNHIGCHTLGDSEVFFKGTQELERELISMLSVDIFRAEPGGCDGYLASGGTEANIQAVWIYRNFFLQRHKAALRDIAILCSEDTHYSIPKAANLLNLALYTVPVVNATREILPEELDRVVNTAMAEGVKYFIVIANMGTTMFGSVDDPGRYVDCLKANGAAFRLHIDAAFGGFIYPFSNPANRINFLNPDISSIALDAHKMLQAPYGTGIFLARKGLMQYVYTEQAQYVNGLDITLCGSRSGANAIAAWMILCTYGPHGWFEKINKLLYRTNWCCDRLDEAGIRYYRNPHMNIIAIKAAEVPPTLAVKYGLVPDTHGGTPKWYKIVVMDHVELDLLQDFIADMQRRS